MTKAFLPTKSVSISRYDNSSDPAFSAVAALPDGAIISGGCGFNNGSNRALLADSEVYFWILIYSEVLNGQVLDKRCRGM